MRPADAQRSPAEISQPSPSGSNVSTPTIQLPKGGGAIRGISEKFAANPVRHNVDGLKACFIYDRRKLKKESVRAFGKTALRRPAW
jgi:hypothetical protein